MTNQIEIVHTYYDVKNTRTQAQAFQLLLAAEQGYSSQIVRIPEGHRVIASDGKAVDFLRTPEETLECILRSDGLA